MIGRLFFRLFVFVSEMIDRQAFRMRVVEYAQKSCAEAFILSTQVIYCKKGKTRYDLIIVCMPGQKNLVVIGHRHGNATSNAPKGTKSCVLNDSFTQYEIDREFFPNINELTA